MIIKQFIIYLLLFLFVAVCAEFFTESPYDAIEDIEPIMDIQPAPTDPYIGPVPAFHLPNDIADGEGSFITDSKAQGESVYQGRAM